MPVWLLGLLKHLPGVGALIDKFLGGNAEAEKIRAQVELEEAKAFTRGRIAPRYWKQYAGVFVFLLFACLVMVAVFFPGVIDGDIRGGMREVLKMANEMPGF